MPYFAMSSYAVFGHAEPLYLQSHRRCIVSDVAFAHGYSDIFQLTAATATAYALQCDRESSTFVPPHCFK